MKKQKVIILTGCLLSLIFILSIFSFHNVDPLQTDWVIGGGGDNLQHYLGWRFFRESRWTRYILFMQNLNYPIGTSVIVTDSNPLFCIIFKLLRSVLPNEFQFNGIWIVFSYILLAYFSGKVGWKLTHNEYLTTAGIVLSFLNPVILQRALIHDTLTAHWLILAAFWLAINYDKKWNSPGWFLLAWITLLVHIYFIPMLAFVLFLQIIHMLIKKQGILRVFHPLIMFAVSLMLGYFVLGYSHILPQTGSYGELSLNLNAFINPDSIPALLKPRPQNPLQYEGFNYWGIGMLILILSGILIGKKTFIRTILPYVIPALLLLILALSNNIYFDNTLLIHFDLPDQINSFLSVFRSSGRLVWPIYYSILFVSLYIIGKESSKKRITLALAFICVLMQIFDLRNFYIQAGERFRNPANQLTDLNEESFGKVMDGKKYLYVSDGDSKSIDSLAFYAVQKNMTFNRFASARSIEPVYGGDVLDMNTLTCQQLQTDSVYVFLSEGTFREEIQNCESFDMRRINDWFVLTSSSTK